MKNRKGYNRVWNNKITVLILGFLFLLPCFSLAMNDLNSSILLEGGQLWPTGNLGANFSKPQLGLGAGRGYEAGFRFRLPVSPIVSISPGFHFSDFKSHVLTDVANQEFKTEAFSYRFTVEGMYKPRCADREVRPFVALAAGLYRNRIVGFYDDPAGGQRNSSVNSLGYSIRWGVSANNFEFSWVIHRNRVDTWRYFQTSAKESYRWNNFGFRLGYSFPR